jgi:hypothetical protein
MEFSKLVKIELRNLPRKDKIIARFASLMMNAKTIP